MASGPTVGASAASAGETGSLWQAALMLADRVMLPRLAFRQAIDGLLNEMGNPALPRSFMHAVATALRNSGRMDRLDPSEDKTAFALAFAAMGEEVALFNVALALCARGVFDAAGGIPVEVAQNRKRLADELLKVMGRTPVVDEAPVGQAQDLVGRAEAVTDVNAVWIDPARLSPAVMLACRRVCRVIAIQADGQFRSGTGFLVGPSAVMTNWHVVAELITIFGNGPLAPNALRFHFDNLRGGSNADITTLAARSENWLLAESPMGLLSPAGREKEVGWWMDANERRTWLAGLDDTLDFAVIALDAAPGELRGWYNIGASAAFDATGSCQVFHHPAGQGLSFSTGSITFPPPPVKGNRLFHTASTVRGSSGGLLVNWLGLPVGLHHAGYGPEILAAGGKRPLVPDEIINAAVPIAAIAKKIGSEKLRSITTSVRLAPPRGCIDGRQPLFGRSDLLAALEELSSDVVTGPQKRLLWIKPPPEGTLKRPGKTFSVAVMKALLPRHIFIELTADMVKTDGRAMAAFLLDRISPGRQVVLPEVTDASTTEAAYHEHHLIPRLFEELNAAAAGKQVWIVLDELDTMSLPDTAGRRFLDMLYDRMPACPQLRLVLIGLKTSVPSIPEDLLRPHLIEVSDIGRLFQDWLGVSGEREVAMDPAVKRLLGEVMRSYAGAEQPMQRLAEFAREHLVSALSDFVQAGKQP